MAVAVALALGGWGAAAQPLSLVRGGKPQAVIVIQGKIAERCLLRDEMTFPGKRPLPIAEVAKTLQSYIAQVSGAELPVQAAPPAAGGAAAGSASGLVGTWEFTRETQQGTRTNMLIIKPDMTGTYKMRDTEVPVTDLKVDGDNVSFKVVMKFNENEFPMEFKGKVEGGTLKGEFITSRGSREAVGKKVQ